MPSDSMFPVCWIKLPPCVRYLCITLLKTRLVFGKSPKNRCLNLDIFKRQHQMNIQQINEAHVNLQTRVPFKPNSESI